MKFTDVDDIFDDFAGLLGRMRTAAVPHATLDPTTLSKGVQDSQSHDDKTQALAERVAQNTPLTVETVRPIVDKALSDTNDNADQAAQKVANQLAGLTGSAELQLSKPNPLTGPWRAAFAVAMAIIMILALVFTDIAHSNGTAEYIALGVLGGLAWLGAVLFVMGYQNVDLKGSSGSGSGGSSGSSAGNGSSAPSANGASGSKSAGAQ